ncbi:MAG: amidohydrolase family protein [Gammaproteobacteria bacterium]|nr:amidohydrolase family protein [Gammaproteobacteria bacterium]
MNKLSQSAFAALLTGLVSQSVSADQTGHVYGLHDRSLNKVAFTNATVYTEPGKKIERATLIIDNGRIESIERGGKVPQDAKIIDLTGHTVYPGFIDPYSDYVFGSAQSAFRWGEPPQYEGKRSGGNAWNDAIHAEVDWVDQFKADNKAAKDYIHNGFTAVQTAKLDGIFQGQGVTVSLADGIPNDLVYRAHARHFASFNKGSSTQSYPSSLMGSIALIRQTLSDAKWYQSAKGKTDRLITNEPVEYNAALEQLSELERSGVIFNPEDSLDTPRADQLFDQYRLDVVYVADGQEYARMNDIKQVAATFVVPFNFPEKPDVTSFEAQLDTSLAELRHWERAPANPAILEDNKIPFAFTHFGLKKKNQFWKNVKTAVKHGLSEQAALAALTTTPARIAGVADQSGKIAPGMFADLVISDGNLFQDGTIKSVYLMGKEQNIKPLNITQVAGDYTLNLKGTALTLQLTQEDAKVSGKLSLSQATPETTDSTAETDSDEKSEKAKTVAIKSHGLSDNQLQFSADLSDLGLPGAYRFTLRKDKGQLLGQVTAPDLARLDIVANKSADANAKANQESTPEAPTYLSELTYPNRAFAPKGAPAQQRVHIKNATIWTSDKQGVLTNADMIIRDGKIREVGQNLKTPSGYTVIDGTNKHVTAGIIDEHSHIAISKGVNEGSDAITAEVRIGDVLNPEDINIYRALAGGTTTAQLLHGSANPIGGQAQVIKLRWGENANGLKFTQAPASIKFALGENVKQSNWGDKFTIRYPQTRMGVETIVRDAFLRAREYKQSFERYDDLSRSVRKTTAPPRRNFRLDTLNEILDQQRFVHSHSYVASEILSLMKIAEDFNFKIQTFTHILEGYKVADEMAKHGASASTFADWWAYKFEVYDAIPGNTCLMMKNGVNVSVNSDSGDLIRRLNTEAAKSINYCDMKPEDAIKMVTINPAKQLKVDKFTGSLVAGKDADFVIWNDNPLSVYAKVLQTWVDGRRYFDREQDEAMRIALAQEKSRLIQKALGVTESGSDATQVSDAATSNRFLLKDNTVWHCEDNFDFWQWQASENHTAAAAGHQGAH